MKFSDLDYSVIANNDIEISVSVEDDEKDHLSLEHIELSNYDFNEFWKEMDEAMDRYMAFRKEYCDGEVGTISVCDGKLYINVTFEPDDWECIYG